MPIGLTYKQAKALAPCESRFKAAVDKLGGAKKWSAREISAADARQAGCSFDDVAWAASAIARTNPDIERRLRLWLADCAARVLPIYEKAGKSSAPREAIVAARQFARGETSDAARAAARAAAGAAAQDWQFTRLCERLSDDEPADLPLP